MLTNSASLSRFSNSFHRNTERASRSLERLSTGKRINHAADDPAGLVAAEGFRTELTDLKAEEKAANSRRFQVHQQQAALTNIHHTLYDVKGNVVSAADGNLSTQQKTALQQQVDASINAIDRIARTTRGLPDVTKLEELQSGQEANLVDGDLAQADAAVNSAVTAVASKRAALGAEERYKLDVDERLREDKTVILTEALSQIEDTDFAAEVAEFTQAQVLKQGSLAAMAYAQQNLADHTKTLLESLDEVFE